ncbi:hypothetical protein LOZ12_000087 [Ophidiomyces ophidiicola]|nr:hypothetical protein LOZ12_000087 [Ophidiomyces ophidiicola]
MASLPPQSTSTGRRRQPSSEQPQSEHSSFDHETDSYMSTSDSFSDDQESTPAPVCPPSSSYLANSEARQATESSSQEDQTSDADSPTETQTSNISASTPIPINENEPKKCWICYTDETEDSPLNSEWRSPCPCALYAHEACLLDWLADLENPKSRRYGGRSAKMNCPQCKSEIVIARPKNIVVEMMRKIEQLAGRLVLPGVLFTLAGTVWAGCCAHGVYSMYLIFGTEEARQILDSGPRRWNPRVNLGLPVIPLTLIFSRTRYAESLLPAIPVLFFATQRAGDTPVVDLDLWPPSASVTFAALPYAKSFYSILYERLFGKLERKWIAEVQPRAGENEESTQEAQNQNNNGNQHPRPAPENGDELLMEIGLELELGIGKGEDPPFAIQAIAQGGEDAAQADNPPGEAQNQFLGRRQNELIHDTSSIADTVLGALFFPALSAGMGGLLKFTLPRSWTTLPASFDKSRATFLQTRWGRSVLGGCLFVLLKDALVLYCRWKLAQAHRKRRVLNYDRVQKRVVNS